MDDLEFRPDLYRGTAEYYDRFRVPYPPDLIAELAGRPGAGSQGRLLGLACGTGQLAFALHSRFAEVWAVDQEPDMVGLARRKAGTAGIGTIRFLTCAAEDLAAPGEYFDLVTIGNAFHRLRRSTIAARVLRWLRPGGLVALVCGGDPWTGDAPWQRVLAAARDRWMTRTGAHGRIPPGYDRDRAQRPDQAILRPDQAILREAGFELAGSRQFRASWEWTPEALIGFAYSTSVLSPAVLGDQAPQFQAELRRELQACAHGGPLRQTVTFGCELARRPA